MPMPCLAAGMYVAKCLSPQGFLGLLFYVVGGIWMASWIQGTSRSFVRLIVVRSFVCQVHVSFIQWARFNPFQGCLEPLNDIKGATQVLGT